MIALLIERGSNMREILYRGKGDTRFNSGGWVYGVPIKDYEGDWQLCTDCTKTTVLPETIGEYTGLTDKNGKKIFEGDIVTYEDAEADYEGYHDNVFLNCGEVVISAWVGICFTNRQTVEMDDLYISETKVDCEIIGNIHDNPELKE